MTALATSVDFEDRLGRTLTTSELDRVDALLSDASATIVHYTGQQFTKSESTQRCWVRRQRVWLTQRPVLDVSAVSDKDSNAVDFEWHGPGFDQVYLLATPYRSVWPLNACVPPVVDVTYTHGYDSIPDDVVSVCCSIALRTFGVAADSGGIQSESIEGYSYTLGTTAAAGTSGLLPEEKRALDVYRRVVGFIDGGRL